MSATSDFTRTKSVPEERPIMPWWRISEKMQDTWCHPRRIPIGELVTEQHVIKFLKDRGIEADLVKFYEGPRCNYASYGYCYRTLDKFAKLKFMSEEDASKEHDARVLNTNLWSRCGIYIGSSSKINQPLPAASDSSQAKLPVPKEEPPNMVRLRSSPAWRHLRTTFADDLEAEEHVVNFLLDRGVKVNHVKFDDQDVCGYLSNRSCMAMLESFARFKVMSEERDARGMNKLIWEKCGIYIQ